MGDNVTKDHWVKETWGKFHQCSMKLLKTFLYEKAGRKMLMKLTNGYIGELGATKNQNRYFVIYVRHLKTF